MKVKIICVFITGNAAYYTPLKEQHFVSAISDIFHPENRFNFLTKITICVTFKSFDENVVNHSNEPIVPALYIGLGKSCPQLQVLDLKIADHTLYLTEQILLFMLFSDPYRHLHKYVYMPKAVLKFANDNDPEDHGIFCQLYRKHNRKQATKHKLPLPDRYCPYCPDPWAGNNPGRVWYDAYQLDKTTPVLDDRLYEAIEDMFGKKAPNYLQNMIKASDLVAAANAPEFELERPEPYKEGKEPWLMDFETGRPLNIPSRWKTKYVPVPTTSAASNLVSMAFTLTRLELYAGQIEVEQVPFLLKVLPNLQKLKEVNMPRGLRMIREIPALRGIRAKNLRELKWGESFFLKNQEPDLDHRYLYQVLRNKKIKRLIKAFEIGETLLAVPKHAKDPKQAVEDFLARDAKAIAEVAPGLRYLDIGLNLLPAECMPDSPTAWWAFADSLQNIEQLHFKCCLQPPYTNVLSVFNERFKRLKDVTIFEIDERGSLDFFEVLQCCSNVPEIRITLSLPRDRLDVIDVSRTPAQLSLANLRHCTIRHSITPLTLVLLMQVARNLETLRSNAIVKDSEMTDRFSLFDTDESVALDQTELMSLLRLIETSKLTTLAFEYPGIVVKNVRTAICFVDALPISMTSFFRMVIRLDLHEYEYQFPDNQELPIELVNAIDTMGEEINQFKEKVKQRMEVFNGGKSLHFAQQGLAKTVFRGVSCA